MPLAVVLLLLGLPAGVPESRAQAPAPPGEAGPAIVVKDIAVEGNRRIQEAVILGKVTSRVGQPFIPAQFAEDIRAIFALGFFDDVQLRTEDFEGGVRAIFVVVERPFIRDIVFAGNRRIGTATLQEKVDLKLGTVYNPVEVTRAAEKLKEHYEEEGYFEVAVTPDAEKAPDGDVIVTFRIAEGRKITIDEIVIEGARGVRPSQLKAVMATQERQYFILRGTVQRQKLDEDLDRIKQAYDDSGYLQARVESSEVKLDRERARATIIIKVFEGPLFKTGTIDITGNSVLPLEDIRRQVLLKTGQPFSRARLRDTIRGITDLYGTIGRAAADVTPNIDQDMAQQVINLKLEISEGPETYVERINITGNTRSQEKILRREIPMAEGELFTSPKLARARQRLVNLGYFEQVNASTTPGTARDKIVVNIQVTERPTGLFSLGGGYSSADGLVGTVDLSQRNFLGRGWEVFLRIRAGGETQQGTIGFTEPWLFDRPLSAGFDLFKNRQVFDDFTSDATGGDIRLGHPIGEFSRINAIYRASSDTISDIEAPPESELFQEEGTTLTSMVGLTLSYDSRDNVYQPTKGLFASVSGDLAGVGFGVKFYRFSGAASYFHPLWFGHILAGRLAGGYIKGYGGDTSPLFERFFLGGPNSVRSFPARELSPVDSTGQRIGGNIFVLGSVEYIIPLFFGFRAAVFFDAGQAYGPDIPGGTRFDLGDLRYAAGAGLRWASPFGPLRVDYGFNLNRRAGEDAGAFQFAVGSAF